MISNSLDHQKNETVKSMPNEETPQSEDLSQYLPHHNPTSSKQELPPSDSDLVKCKNCGYNLRGLRPTRPCPECGHVSRRDPKTPYLKPADHHPAYLKRIALGLRVLALAWLLIAPLNFISFAVKFARPSIDIANTIGLALTLLAVFLISARSKKEPPITKKAYHIRQSLALFLTAAALLSQLFVLFASKFTIFFGTGFSPTTTIILALAAQSVICLIIAPLAHLMHDEPLARRVNSLAWVMPLLAYIGIPIAFLIFGRTIRITLIPLMLLPLAAYFVQIPFFLTLISLRRHFTWTIRYQKEYNERTARLRPPNPEPLQS